MTENSRTSIEQWTSVQAYTFAVVCLLVGIAGGWFIRGSQSPAVAGSKTTSASAQSMQGADAGQMPSPAELRKMADTQAAPLLDKLKSDTNNPELLVNIGNLYYDAQQYQVAVEYYGRALKTKPADASARTDMATAYWYMGDADTALAEFNKALSDEPNKANTLFNRGLVKWQAKMDIAGAVADWEKLLATHPNYEAKEKVEQMIAEAQRHTNVKPGTQAKPLSQ